MQNRDLHKRANSLFSSYLTVVLFWTTSLAHPDNSSGPAGQGRVQNLLGWHVQTCHPQQHRVNTYTIPKYINETPFPYQNSGTWIFRDNKFQNAFRWSTYVSAFSTNTHIHRFICSWCFIWEHSFYLEVRH